LTPAGTEQAGAQYVVSSGGFISAADLTSLQPLSDGEHVGTFDPVRRGNSVPIRWRMHGGAYAFLRFRPVPPLSRMNQLETVNVLRSGQWRIPYIGHSSSLDFSYCRHGGTVFPVGRTSDPEIAISEISILTPDCELILVDGDVVLVEGGTRTLYLGALEKHFRQWTSEALEFYAKCFAPQRVEVVAGLAGIDGCVVGLPQTGWGAKQSGVGYVNEFGFRWTDASKADYSQFFVEVWRAFGVERPT
jgi:hypothetical protein